MEADLCSRFVQVLQGDVVAAQNRLFPAQRMAGAFRAAPDERVFKLFAVLNAAGYDYPLRWGIYSGDSNIGPADRPLVEDLNEIHTYPLDFGAYIASLVPPHYRTYGTYQMFPLDEDFIQRHPGFDDFFYDFIVGREGQLKIVLGHYVPR